MNIKTLLISLPLIFVSSYSNAQLSIGDIAFVGYNTDSGPGGSTDHSFSFITLTDIPGNEIVFFTEEGWNDVSNSWAGTTEGHIEWTAPSAGLTCGTVVYITESGSDIFTVTGGGVATLESGTSWNLSGGDQVLAYQATTPEPATTPIFISGLNGDDGNGTPVSFNPLTMWNSPSAGPLGTARSGLPAGLTNGVNCVSLFITTGTEEDNAKYTGSLTGTSTVVRAAINDRTNWIFDNSTAFNITPSAYSPMVSCILLPIDLITFEGSQKDELLKLSWSTASEINNEKFEIEESRDNRVFHKIGEVRGKGTVFKQQLYSFYKEKPQNGVSFYRLKQIDFDGQYEYSKVISVNFKGKTRSVGEFYPNPSKSGLVNIEYSNQSDTKIIVSIFDLTGELVANHTQKNSSVTNDIGFNFSNLKTGIYIVKIGDNQNQTYRKLIINK